MPQSLRIRNSIILNRMLWNLKQDVDLKLKSPCRKRVFSFACRHNWIIREINYRWFLLCRIAILLYINMNTSISSSIALFHTLEDIFQKNDRNYYCSTLPCKASIHAVTAYNPWKAVLSYIKTQIGFIRCNHCIFSGTDFQTTGLSTCLRDQEMAARELIYYRPVSLAAGI